MKEEYNLLREFRKRYQRLSVFKDRELRKLTMKQKFYQLASVISLGFGLKLNSKEDPSKHVTRERWVFLKRAFDEGRI